MDEQLDVLPYSLITVCLYAPIDVMSDYHRYGLRVGEGQGGGRSGLVGEWTAKFPQGICYSLRNINFN